MNPPHSTGRVRRRLGRIVAPPQGGWSSVVLLAAMLLVTGLAMDHPRLAGFGPNGSQTAFLPVVILLGGLVGVVLARLPLPVVLAHLLGACVGVGILLVAWASALSAAPTLSARLADINQAAATLFQDVVVEHGRTEQTIGFLVVVGAIAWTTGQFAAYNLVRRGVVAPAIVAIGTLVLVIALAPTVGEGAIYPHLVLLTGLALLLILRSNLAHQQAGWRRRHIVGGRGVEQLFLRGGAMVCIVALMGAALLAANVVAAPLRETLTSLDQRLLDMADAIDALFGGIGSSESAPTGSYGDTTRVEDTWTTSNQVVFTALSDDDHPHYWRGAAFSRFDGASWSRDRLNASVVAVPAHAGLLDGSGDAVSADASGTRDITVVVTSRTLDGETLLSPAAPLSVDRDATVILDGDGGPFGEIEFREELPAGDSYTVVARVPRVGKEGLTQNVLAASGNRYPRWALRYTDVAPGTLSDAARGQTAQLIRTLPEDQRDPFHVAQQIESWFAGQGDYATDGNDFAYASDISNVCRPTEGVVDCLLRTQQGFCQQYATAMTLMLRSQNIPTRYVQGFLPGERMADGSFSIPMAAAHAWVEVYFPGHGWVRFDPTPGGNRENGQSTSDLPVGDPVPTPTPSDPDAPDPTPVFSDAPSPSPSAIVTPPQTDPPSANLFGLDLPWPTLLMAILGLVGLITLMVAVRRVRRIPGREPDVLYRALVALATRMGHGPRPDQTAYEYAAALAATVPRVSGDLHAVARAKVEATYGGRTPGGDALDALIGSYRRARRALFGLVLHRRRNRR